jgi:enoyl-CoA hydratase
MIAGPISNKEYAVDESFESIRLEVVAQVATITLSRAEALNAITAQMLAELVLAFEAVARDKSISVVVLTGDGKAFSAGVDLKALGDRQLPGGKVGDFLDIPARRVIALIQGLDAIVVAKVNGYCFTGALEIALACDIVVVAEEAVLGDTHAKWGLRPTWGMSQRLPRAVGRATARRLSYTASTFTGKQAAEWGLAAQAAPRDDLDGDVNTLVHQLLANSREALIAYKDLYRAADQLPLTDGLAYEAATDYPISDTDDRLATFR